MSAENPPSPNSNKRKRGASDQDSGRMMKSPTANGDDAMSNAHFQHLLLQNLSESSSSNPVHDASARTAQAALQQPQSSYPEPFLDQGTVSVGGGFESAASSMPQSVPQHQMNPAGQGIFDARASQQNKPAVGSTEWHQQRKDNHKEVERRRREVINEGIENLAKLIPTSDKNKGAILAGAIRYIQELQAKIENFDNERRIFDLTQQELTKRNEALRDNAQRSWQETAKWMGRCKEHGLQYDDYDISVAPDEALDDVTSANIGNDASTAFTSGAPDKVENSLS